MSMFSRCTDRSGAISRSASRLSTRYRVPRLHLRFPVCSLVSSGLPASYSDDDRSTSRPACPLACSLWWHASSAMWRRSCGGVPFVLVARTHGRMHAQTTPHGRLRAFLSVNLDDATTSQPGPAARRLVVCRKPTEVKCTTTAPDMKKIPSS